MRSVNEKYVPYWDTFGGRVVRHRNERDMTEEKLADEIKRIAKSEGSLGGDTVVLWERNKDVPRSPEIFKALSEILIDQNEKIPEDRKAEARAEFAQAHANTKAFVDKTHGPKAPPAEKFGELITAYRRQRGVFEDELAEQVFRRAVIPPDENLDEVDYSYIAEIQTGRITPSKGLVLAMIKAFSRTKPKGDVQAEPGHYLPEDDKAGLLEAWERLPKPDVRKFSAPAPAVERQTYHGITPSDEIRDIKRWFVAMFADERGVPRAPVDLDKILREIAPGLTLGKNDYTNLLGVDSKLVYSLSEGKLAGMKAAISKLLVHFGKEEHIDETMRKCDELRAAILEQQGRTAERDESKDTTEKEHVGVPSTADIRELKNELRLFFAKPSGQSRTRAEINEILERVYPESKLQTRDYANFLGVDSKLVYPTSHARFSELKEMLSLALLELDPQANTDDFGRKCDELYRAMLVAQQQAEPAATRPGRYPTPGAGVVLTPAQA